jgi:hypothetical protein
VNGDLPRNRHAQLGQRRGERRHLQPSEPGDGFDLTQAGCVDEVAKSFAAQAICAPRRSRNEDRSSLAGAACVVEVPAAQRVERGAVEPIPGDRFGARQEGGERCGAEQLAQAGDAAAGALVQLFCISGQGFRACPRRDAARPQPRQRASAIPRRTENGPISTSTERAEICLPRTP